jgi:hypothetical protein
MGKQIDRRPVTLARAIPDRHACLVFLDGALAALLTRLDDEAHEELRGSWFLEVGFGPFETAGPRMFESLDDAVAWVSSVADG